MKYFGPPEPSGVCQLISAQTLVTFPPIGKRVVNTLIWNLNITSLAVNATTRISLVTGLACVLKLTFVRLSEISRQYLWMNPQYTHRHQLGKIDSQLPYILAMMIGHVYPNL